MPFKDKKQEIAYNIKIQRHIVRQYAIKQCAVQQCDTLKYILELSSALRKLEELITEYSFM